MPLTFRCHCRRLLRVPDDYAGRQIACPACAAALVVPAPTPPPTPLPKAPPKAPILLPEEDEEIVETVAVFDKLDVLAGEEESEEASDELLPEEPDAAHAGPDSLVAAIDAGDLLPEDPDDLPEETVAVVDNLEEVADEAADESGDYALKGGEESIPNHAVTGALRRYRVGAGSITALAYGADHTTALVADHEELLFLNLQTGKSKLGPRRHRAAIHCLAISADCRLALSGDLDGDLLLWDIKRSAPLRWLEGHRSEVTAIDFSSDGIHAVSGSVGGAVHLWHCPTGEIAALDDGQLGQCVSCVRFSPDGRLLLALGDEGRARLWTVAGGRRAAALQAGAETMRSAAFTHDSKSIVAASGKRFKICQWDLASGERQPCFRGFSKKYPRVSRTWLSGDGRALLALGFSLEREARRQTDVPELPMVPIPIFIMASLNLEAIRGGLAGPDHSLLNSKTKYQLERWDVTHERGVCGVQLGEQVPIALACSPDGRRALLGFARGMLLLCGL